METTISVICFKSKTLASGEHPLMIRITKDRKRSMKSLGLSIHAKHWDFKKNEPKSNCHNRDYFNQIILKTKLEYERKFLQMQVNEESFTTESFIRDDSAEKQIKAQTVEDFCKTLVADLRASGNVGNSYAYNSLKAVFLVSPHFNTAFPILLIKLLTLY